MVPGRTKEHGRLDFHGIASGEFAAALRTAALHRTRCLSESGDWKLRSAPAGARAFGERRADHRVIRRSHPLPKPDCFVSGLGLDSSYEHDSVSSPCPKRSW